MPSVIPNGEAVRTRRSRKGLTQEELAEKAGYSRKTIERIENGNGTSIETLENIAEILDVRVEILLMTDNVMSGDKADERVSGVSLEIIVSGDAPHEARARVGAKILQLLGEEVSCINIRLGSVVLGYAATDSQRQSLAFYFLSGKFSNEQVLDVIFCSEQVPAPHRHFERYHSSSALPRSQFTTPSLQFLQRLALSLPLPRRYPRDEHDLEEAFRDCLFRICLRPWTGSVRRLFKEKVTEVLRGQTLAKSLPAMQFSSLPNERVVERVVDPFPPKPPPPPPLNEGFERLLQRIGQLLNSPLHKHDHPPFEMAGYHGSRHYVAFMAFYLGGHSTKEIAAKLELPDYLTWKCIVVATHILKRSLPSIEEFFDYDWR